ncbi:membrane-associating domain-containing protein [Apiospora kogelbergensis]|uniref:Membrane-associating domain-containing protein n=1 Tax=Apiospora kogelbergensis TaxID=1337665 RepID=A0AAW0RDM3_9PEZI
MALGFLPIVHAVAAVFAIIELGLTGYVVSLYQGWWGWGAYSSRSPDRINFMLFNSIWSLLVLAYVGITPIYMTGWFHKLAALVLNALTALFWFAGSVALAVAVGAPHCDSSYCSSLQAAVAFGFFLWAIFMGLTVLDGLESLRSRGHNVPNSKPSAYPGA